MSLVIENAARDSMMQLTDQNWFMRNDEWQSCTRYSLRTGEAIKESVVRDSIEPKVDERVEDGESMAMLNEFYKKQGHV